MKFRLPLFSLCFILACTPLQAAPKKEKADEPGLLKRVGGMLWPFKKKTPSDTAAASAANSGKAWRQLAPSISIEPMPLKLSDVRTMKVTLLLANRGKKLTQLDFPTSQRVEVLVKDASGKLIEQWSEDQAFSNEPSLVTINPGERLEYVQNVATRELKAGVTYTVEGFFPNFEALRASKQITPLP